MLRGWRQPPHETYPLLTEKEWAPVWVFGAPVVEEMTAAEARLVDHWVAEGASCREVARLWFDEMREVRLHRSWRGSRLLGRELCARAEALRDEFHRAPPW